MTTGHHNPLPHITTHEPSLSQAKQNKYSYPAVFVGES